MPPAATSPKLDALTGLRYAAALLVLLAHLQLNYPRDWPFTHFAQHLSLFGMPLFFVLSGFLMTYNYGDELHHGGRRAVWKFAVARFARIYPVYVIALLLSLSHMLNFFHDLRDRPDDTARCLAATVTMTQSWFHSHAFIDYMHTRTVCQAYNPASWSVSVEFFFYSVFPLLAMFGLWRFRRVSQVALGMVGVMLPFVAIDFAFSRLPAPDNFAQSGYRWFLYFSPYMRIGEFLIGCLLGRLFLITAHRESGRWEGHLARLTMYVSIVLCLGYTWLPQPPQGSTMNNLFMNIGFAPFCAAIIFVLARYESTLRRILSTPLAVLLGESSYCMYLLHSLVLSFFVNRLTREDDLNGWWVTTYNSLAMVFCLHVVSLGMYQFVETPARRVLRKWLSPREVDEHRERVIPLSSAARAA